MFFRALGDAGKQKKDIEIQNYEVQTPEERGQMRQHTRVEVEVRQSCTLPLLKSEELYSFYREQNQSRRIIPGVRRLVWSSAL